MKTKDNSVKENQIGDDSLLGLAAELKGLSEGENNSHDGKPTKKNLPVKIENHSYYCVVCGRDSKIGDFCSISCQNEQAGI